MEKKKDKKIGEKVVALLPFIIGGFCGYFGGRYTGESGMAFGDWLFDMSIIFLIIYVAFYIQIIVHETGHLVAGIMSGYKFLSFRIAKYMIVQKEGKYILKKQIVAGTGGQCLMIPPKEEPYECPYILYGLGGILANFILSILSLATVLIMPTDGWQTYGLYILSGIGMIFVVVNGVPMRMGGLPNDGYNLILLKKDRESRYAMWVQLYVNGLLVQGKKLKDIPLKYHELPEGADVNNPLICVIKTLQCSYLHSIRDFEGAKELTYKLFEEAKDMPEVYRNELTGELLFYEMIGECRKEEIDRLYTKKLRNYLQITSTSIDKRRILYTYELLVNKDEKAAKKQREAFDKLAKYYPYEGEIENEMGLMELVQNLYQCEKDVTR